MDEQNLQQPKTGTSNSRPKYTMTEFCGDYIIEKDGRMIAKIIDETLAQDFLDWMNGG